MGLLLGLLVAVGIFYAATLDWRRAIKAVFVILVLEGALRKWVLPQASEMIYFLKDLVLLGGYVGFLTSGNKFLIKNNVINILILLVAGWCFFQAFNPSLGSPLIGVLGLRSYLFYIPLMWIMPSLFQSEEELYKFLRSHLLLLIPVGILGIIQFFSPASSPVNAYAWGEEGPGIATFGFGADAPVRVTSTFSYISGYSLYLPVCLSLLIPLLSIKQSQKWRWLTVVELLLLSVNLLMTGSRTPVFASILFLLCYTGIRVLMQPSTLLKVVQKFSIPAVLIFTAVAFRFRSATDAFWRRATINQDVSARISGGFMEPLEFFQHKGLDGYGTGATHQAVASLQRILGLPGGETIHVAYEAEMGRVALELGPFGFLLWYGLRISIIIGLWLVFLKLKSSFLRQLALAACLIQLIQISGHLVFHHTFSVYYWFFSSFVFLLPRLEQIGNLQQTRQDVQVTYFPSSPYR